MFKYYIIINVFITFSCFSMALYDTPLPKIHAAAQAGNIFSLKIYTNEENINSRDHKNRTPLHLAVIGGHLRSVKFLIESGANIEDINLQHLTPLGYACQEGHLKIVEYLLEKGAKIEGNLESGYTPLSIAIIKDHISIVKLLIDKGAEINSKRFSNTTPLFHSLKNIQLTELLIKSGADINVKTTNFTTNSGKILYGETILHRAISLQNIDVIKLLLASGADVNKDHGDGRSTLKVAEDTGNQEIISLIHKAYK